MQLAKEKISCNVVDLRTVSPLDEDTIIELVEDTGKVVIVDESSPRCNIGTDISALIVQNAFKALKAPIQIVSPPHTPVPFAPELEDAYMPNAGKIVKTKIGEENYDEDKKFFYFCSKYNCISFF